MIIPRTLTSEDTFDDVVSILIGVNVTAKNNRISDELPELSKENDSGLMGRMAQEMNKAFWAEHFPVGIPPDKSPDSTVPSGTGTSLRSGVEICSNPCTEDKQKQIGVSSKHSQGQTVVDCIKTKKVVCVELTPKLSCIMISQLLKASDLENNDIADGWAN